MNNQTPANNAFFRQLLFLIVLIALGIIIFDQLNFFIGSFLGAITLYVILRNLQTWLTEVKKWKPWISSLILVLGITLILLGLGFLLFEIIAAEIPEIHTSDILTGLNQLLGKINDWTGYKIVPEKILNEFQGIITDFVSSFINTTYSFAANIFMMLIILYFMLSNGRKMEQGLLKYIPFKGKSLQMLECEVRNMIFSNAVGIPLIMLAQTIASCLIYWLLDMQGIFFWGFVTAIFGLVPVVGTAIVWILLAAHLIINGAIGSGIILILYGIVIIANIDNLVRIVVMKKTADTHPLIVIFGVILGIPLFGFWGIIFGPLLISGFILLTKIYFTEYDIIPDKSKSEKTPPPNDFIV